MSQVTFTVGMPTYDWSSLYQAALQSGTFNITDNSPQTSLILTSGTTQLVIEGSDLRADGARHLTAGAITGFVVISAGQEVVRIDGMATPGSFADLQTLLTEYEAPIPDFGVINLALASLLLMEPFTITGSADHDVIGSTLVGGDVGNLNGGNDAYILDVPANAVTIDGGDGRDYMQIGFQRTDGVILDFGAGTVIDRGTNALLANFTSFEDGRGSEFDDIIRVSNNPDDGFFIEASRGNDEYDGTGDSYVRLSYRFYEELTGLTGGIDVNVAMGTILKPGGSVDHFWNIDTVHGTNYADTFYGSVWSDEFEGLDGADNFNGSGGDDRVNYSAEQGADGVFVNLSDSNARGNVTGSGTVNVAAHTARDSYGNVDTLVSIEEIIGTDVTDRLIGDSKNNAFWGEAGADRLFGNGGHDWLRGGDGNDFLYGGDGDDNLNGGTGNDTITGDEGNDFIDGGEGRDTIDAGSGDFDNIAGSAGNDTLDGNVGYDMYAFDEYGLNEDANGDGNPGGQNEHAGDRIIVTLANGAGAGTITGFFGVLSNRETPTRAALNQSFVNLERIRGTVGNDIFVLGADFTNTEDAQQGFNDPLRTGLGAFELIGGKGNDRFTDAAVTGLAMINYNEEKWTHHDFNDQNGYEWGDGGEPGVAVNLSAGNKNIAGFGVVGAGKARDTHGDLDTIDGVVGFELTETDDAFYAGDNGVFVRARGGDDSFTGGAGADQFQGGEGNDTARGGQGIDMLRGENGDDTLSGDAGSDDIAGGRGNDTIQGDAGNDHLNGDEGMDLLHGGSGRDDINGGADNDQIYGEAGNDYMEGADGDDLISGGIGDDEIQGGQGSDQILGDAGRDRLYGGSDGDLIVGGLGADRIEGDDGDDTIHGDDDAASDPAGGNDQINGGAGNDTIHAGYGQDRVDGGDGSDTIYGGFGDDQINGGGNDDTLHGENGEDDIYGGFGNDTIDGGAADDAINGAEGNDTLSGGGGNDNIYGGDGDGDDSLDGGAGADILNGGFGNDTYILGSEADGVDQIWDPSGIDLITSTISRSLANRDQIENLTLLDGSAIDGTGNQFDNVITGNDRANILWGGDGLDTLIGGNGEDELHGEGGNDRLVSGLQRDALFGGDGDDIFDFNLIEAAGNGGQRDTIGDFSQIMGNRDIIDLGDIDANSLTGGDDAFSFNATKGAAFSGAGSLTYFQQVANDHTFIRGDVDGDGVADFQIGLSGLITITADDFLL